MKINCLIVDDESMARQSLERLCTKRPELTVMHVCTNGNEALQIVESRTVDLMFLDVEMPGLTGLELLDLLPYSMPVVLTTSKTEYAFAAFQYQVIDYLKKPITLPRFNQAVDKVVDTIKAAPATPPPTNDIYVRTDGRFVRLAFDDILYVENTGDYVKIRMNSHTHVVHTTMKNLEEKLDPRRFLRVHRTFIVNLSRIIDIEENTLVIADKVIPISRANKAELMNRINIL
ncbi:LytTR family DNA-binding domain-containing protein [Telluribacter sp.]|jgi:DNA-binding LytR/AlgR family response regulator|uniref:LytR/AlgR family response regulator transcription factor n=1 Tax=Telluribacter sp. TaxID=1978767 RepID=UPI002E1371BE|nr:LytTR family DNA-binding domain-containing protein [Telluribacter sp.]